MASHRIAERIPACSPSHRTRHFMPRYVSIARHTAPPRVTPARALPLRLLSLLIAQAFAPASMAQEAEADALDLDAVKVVGADTRGRPALGVLGARALKDTPYSITALSREQIERANPAIVADLFAADASVSNNGQSGYGLFSDRITVRGLSISGSNNLVNGVRYYSWGSEMPLEAVEQVQLLKGSGGFLYGFGAPGGILNFVTKKPTDQPLLGVRVAYESDSIFSEQIDAGGRFGPEQRFGYRLNAWHKRGSSFNGSEVDGDGAALALDFKPTPTLVLSTEFIYQDRRTDSTAPAIALNNYRDNVLPAPVRGSTKLSSDDAYTASRFTSFNVGANWAFAPGWSLDLRAGTVENDYRYPYERLLLLNSAGDYNNRLFDGSNVSSYDFARAIVEGRFQTGPVYHQLVAGVDFQDLQDRYGLNTITLKPGSNINAPVTTRWDYDRSRGVQTWRTSRMLERSLFLSDTIELTPHWSVLAGLRHSKDKEESWEKASNTVSGTYSTVANTPTVALLYRPNDGVTWYGSYIESLESGGTVGDDYTNAGQQLDALVSKQYELGAKWETPGWNANLAVFRLDRGAAYVTEDNTYTQDGITRYDGIEAAADVRLGQAWRLGASAVLLDARYEEDSNVWLVGRQPEGAAKRTAAVNASYDVQAIPGLSLRALVRYQGRTSVYNVASRDVTLYTPAVTLTTLGADYATRIGEHRIVLHGQVDNLFDRKYWSPGASVTTNALSPGRSRTFTLSARYDFY